jgi:signal transduction histidine kinase
VRLAQRLLLGSLLVVTVLVVVIVLMSDRRLDDRLIAQAVEELARETRILAVRWRPEADADSLADVWGEALARRVQLIDTAGRVVGDSEFERPTLEVLGDQRVRPEIARALAALPDTAPITGTMAEGREAYAATRVPSGVIRISLSLRTLDAITRGAREDVLVAGFIAVILASLVAYLFSRAVSRPIVELRDVARGLAAGDLSRRPRLTAPGEVGDLATALHRMADQLAARLNALEKEDALMAALIEALNEGVIAVDGNRRIVLINDNGRRLLALRGAIPIPVDHLPRERSLREALDLALAGSTPATTEIRVDDRMLALAARPLAGGGAVLALFDLSPLRRLEMVRRDFVANVSHELKTPLTVIGGFAETLAEDDLPVEQRRRFAETIQTHARRMQRIVDDLLDLSRIESGGWRPNPTTVDIAAAARDALGTVSDAATAKRVTVVVSPDPAATTVYADATAFRQILCNLIENAVRYTPEGGTVTVLSESAPEGVRVSVRDTGIGIGADHLPRIFERFYRADPARSRDAGGTGLGLSIVRHLVEAHGGRVRAESAVGRGTTISAAFPQAERRDEAVMTD